MNSKEIFNAELSKLIKSALENWKLENFFNGFYVSTVEKSGIDWRFSCRAKVGANGQLLTDLTSVRIEALI
jgi:hypothetical protein